MVLSLQMTAPGAMLTVGFSLITTEKWEQRVDDIFI